MGLYDRDYGRDDHWGQRPGISLDGPRTLTTNLVLITFGVYLIQILTQPSQPAFPGDAGWFTELGSLSGEVLRRPWKLFQFLTYGFLHSPYDIKHILFNMLGLWIFGRTIEQRYGRSEFLAFYLVAIVFAGGFWFLAHVLTSGPQSIGGMLGASGGLSAILILFVFNFPKQMIYIWGVFPLPAWAFGLFFVGQDVLGAVNRADNVAYTAHLGGALFAFLYYRFGWRVSQWLPQNFSLPTPTRRSNLKIHEPEHDTSETDEQVDEILKKIQAQGQESLTRGERRILEKASQEYQRKKR